VYACFAAGDSFLPLGLACMADMYQCTSFAGMQNTERPLVVIAPTYTHTICVLYPIQYVDAAYILSGVKSRVWSGYLP
jgi:hypothetical protein